MFPPIEPHATGWLPVGDGQSIYWEVSGNPAGKPAIHLHGGPGAGLLTGHRRRFDPDRFRIVSFEQRGCGRSRPLVTDPAADLATCTTAASIADIEALRAHLGIESWLVTGVSWGTTLGLAYAQAHPERVTELALMAVCATSAADVRWITEDLRRVFPREWVAFEAAAHRRPGQALIDAYHERITNPATRAAAAQAWCAWEDVHVSLDPRHTPDPHFRDPQFAEVFATLVIHTWKHAAFLEEGALLRGMGRLARVPGVLVHGRLDISSPLDTAVHLHHAWPKSTLVVVDDEGHGGVAMVDALVRAIAGFAAQT